jgi:hypothetical protein
MPLRLNIIISDYHSFRHKLLVENLPELGGSLSIARQIVDCDIEIPQRE